MAFFLMRLMVLLGRGIGMVDTALTGFWRGERRGTHETPDDALAAQARLQRLVARILFVKLLTGAMVLVASLTHTNPYTPPGHEGYVHERPRVFGSGGFKGTIAGPGNHGLSFWRNEVINIDMRPRTYTEDFSILARDDLTISFKFHAVMSVQADSVKHVVEEFGGLDWYGRFIQEPFRTFVRDAVQKHRSTDVKTLMGNVAQDVTERLQTYVEDTPFTVISLVVGNIDYPEQVARAVERKLTAQQLLEEKDTQMHIAQKDAAIELVRARGKAEAQRIIASTLTPEYLQHQAIEAQFRVAESPNGKTIYIPIGDNGLPIVHSAE